MTTKNARKEAERDDARTTSDRPCAAAGLTSYRYRGPYGWIMIGACDDADALREAMRSTHPISPDRLQVWDGRAYVNTQCAAPVKPATE